MSADDDKPTVLSDVLIEDLGNPDTVAKMEAVNKVALMRLHVMHDFSICLKFLSADKTKTD